MTNIIILVNNRWRQQYIEQFMIKYYNHNCNISFFNIYDITFNLQKNKLKNKIIQLYQTYNINFQILALFDEAMSLYTLVMEELNYTHLKGYNFYSFQATNNKYCCRSIISGCNDLKFKKILNSDLDIISLGNKSIFKPLNATASYGIIVLDHNQIIPNHLFKKIVLNPQIIDKCQQYPKLKNYFKKELVGIVEEYIDPQSIKLGVDGFIYNKQIYHYRISENIYYKDQHEKFNYLITPSLNITRTETQQCWNLYDKIITDLIDKGLDNQFCDIEVFVIRHRFSSTVKLMEINCRTFSNQLPIFSMLYGSQSMFDISIQMLLGNQIHFKELDDKRIGICLYRKTIQNKPSIIKSEDNTIFYYKIDDNVSHIYSIGTNKSDIYQSCQAFYQSILNSPSF